MIIVSVIVTVSHTKLLLFYLNTQISLGRLLLLFLTLSSTSSAATASADAHAEQEHTDTDLEDAVQGQQQLTRHEYTAVICGERLRVVDVSWESIMLGSSCPLNGAVPILLHDV